MIGRLDMLLGDLYLTIYICFWRVLPCLHGSKDTSVSDLFYRACMVQKTRQYQKHVKY